MKILLALDSSESSQIALESVAAQQWPEETVLKLLTVVEPFEPTVADSNSTLAKSIQNKRRSDAELLLAESADLLEKNCSEIEIVKEFQESYKPDQTIIDTAKKWPADLITIGSRNRVGIERFLLGSVSNSVLLKASCSVAVVKGTTKKPDSQKVLIAVDDSEYSERVFNSIMQRPWSQKTEFKLLSVVEPLHASISTDNPLEALGEISDKSSLKSQIQIYLGEKAGQLMKEKQTKNVEIAVLEGDPREVILNEIENWKAHQVFVGSQGRTGLKRLLLGSVSQAVASYSTCTVEVVR